MPLPAERLIRNTPREVQKRAQPCLAQRLGKVKQLSNDKSGPFTHAVYRVKGLEDTYRVTLNLFPRAKGKVVEIVPSAPTWVSCTCPFFLYRCEYALAKVGSSDIIHSNGLPPKQTNPRRVPYLCKHAFRALKHLLATKGK